jgi:hypothetical protein
MGDRKISCFLEASLFQETPGFGLGQDGKDGVHQVAGGFFSQFHRNALPGAK